MNSFKKVYRGPRLRQWRKLDRQRNDGFRTCISNPFKAKKMRTSASFKVVIIDEVKPWPDPPLLIERLRKFSNPDLGKPFNKEEL